MLIAVPQEHRVPHFYLWVPRALQGRLPLPQVRHHAVRPRKRFGFAVARVVQAGVVMLDALHTYPT